MSDKKSNQDRFKDVSAFEVIKKKKKEPGKDKNSGGVKIKFWRSKK